VAQLMLKTSRIYSFTIGTILGGAAGDRERNRRSKINRRFSVSVRLDPRVWIQRDIGDRPNKSSSPL
jgi:hypothetical protein